MQYRISYFAALLALVGLVWLAGCSRMTMQAEPQKAVTPLLQYLGAWGMKGAEPGHLDEATGIAADALGNIFITDAGSKSIHKFDPQGTPLLSFQDDWISEPQSIAVDRGGAIYVADARRGSVLIFFPNGDRYHELRLKMRPNAENKLNVAVADDGLIFALDTDSGQISSYTPRSRLVQSWRPLANAATSKSNQIAIAAGPDGNLYVLDATGNRILRYTEQGRLVSEIQAHYEGPGRTLGAEFAVSSAGIFVMDGDGRILHVWTLDGNAKPDVDLAPELGRGRFIPALAASSHRELFVLDAPDSRVLRYRINF